MKLSRKSDYALRALFSLVAYRGQGPISIRVLAEENDIPRRFLEQIMLDLKSRGWVESIAGRDGGFVLAKKPEEITMGEIVRHFDGILAPISCVSTSHYEACSQEGVCRFRRVMLDIRNYIARLMDAATLESVFAGPVVRRDEVFSPGMIYGEAYHVHHKSPTKCTSFGVFSPLRAPGSKSFVRLGAEKSIYPGR